MTTDELNPDGATHQIIESLPKAIQDKIANGFYPEAKLRNLLITMSKYARGETSLWEEKKLQDEGWIAKDNEPTDLNAPENDSCEGQDTLAARLEEHYKEQGIALTISFTKHIISRWCKERRVTPGKDKCPKNIRGKPYVYSLKAWIAWFDKNWLDEKRVGSNRLSAEEEDLAAMEQREKRDAIIHRRWERDQKRGDYVHRSVALATGIAAVKKLHLLIKQEDERQSPKLRLEKLRELGVVPELVEKFSAWDKEESRQITDRREAAMEAIANAIEFPVELNAK